MRTLYDSVDPAQIPASANRKGILVAGYDDGAYADMAGMEARFPDALHVDIAVRWQDRGHVLDVENGDATPAEAVKWCTQTMRATPNSELTIYCNASTWPQVRQAFQQAGVHECQYWIAEWNGVKDFPTDSTGGVEVRAVAKQYLSLSHPNIDISCVVDAPGWKGIDAPVTQPIPVPPPKPPAPTPPPPVPSPPVITSELTLHFPPVAQLVITADKDMVVKAIGVAVRSNAPGGQHFDFPGDAVNVTLKAGQRYVHVTPPGILPSGSYTMFGCYLSEADGWFNLPGIHVDIP